MLIYFDIDGTLISEKTHVFPESARAAIRRARERGHLCAINTGRTGKLVGPDITEAVGFDGLLLGCGTMVVYRGETMFHKTISESDGRRIIESLRRHRIDAVLEGNRDNFRDSDERIFSDSFREFVHYFDSLKEPYKYYEDAPGNFDKFIAYTKEPEQMKAFEEEFGDLLDFVDRKGGNYEMMPKGYSKATAMRYMSELTGIPMSETVAVGDSSNDIPMLQCAGISIVMGNATEDVKKIADHVTTDVDEDGIENALRWLGAIG